MWIWVLIICAVIGAIIGMCGSDNKEKGEGAVSGAAAGCMTGGYCLLQVLIAFVSIAVIFWLFDLLFL